jgi:hypothetical protein
LITPMGKVSWNKSSDDKWTTYSPKQAREWMQINALPAKMAC